MLPFTNLSGEPAQEFFTDGLTEDIITDLSNAPGLFVIARNSTLAYKGRPTDVGRLPMTSVSNTYSKVAPGVPRPDFE